MGIDVAFMPNVGQWFQGITHTINIPIAKKLTSREIRNLYQERYAGEPLVKIVGAPPSVKDISGTHGVEVGGFAVHSGGNRVVSCPPFILFIVTLGIWCDLQKDWLSPSLAKINVSKVPAHFLGLVVAKASDR